MFQGRKRRKKLASYREFLSHKKIFIFFEQIFIISLSNKEKLPIFYFSSIFIDYLNNDAIIKSHFKPDLADCFMAQVTQKLFLLRANYYIIMNSN